MTEEEKKKTVQNISTRVRTGLSFIEEYLYEHPRTDITWIRNPYILFSYYSELLLKAVFMTKESFTSEYDLDEKLRSMGHDLELIGERIGNDILSKFGIKKIETINHEYLIKTDQGDFSVMNFTDIRYDFIGNRVRQINRDEHEKFKMQIEIMLEIDKKLHPLIY